MKTVLNGCMVTMLCFALNLTNAQDLVLAKNVEKIIEKSPDASVKKRTFEFYTYSQLENLKKYDSQIIDAHVLGADVAKKMELLNDTYMVKTPISPGNPTMKISIRKPVVYTSVKKMEKHLKKDYAKNSITKEIAANLLCKVLDVAISIVNDQTEEFEREIKTSETPEMLLELYIQRVTLKYID